MKYINAKIVLFVILLLINFGCSSTKKVPDGEYLLTKNVFHVSGEDKPFTKELPNYVRQKPNGSFLGIPLELLLYNSVPPRYDSIFTEYQDLSESMKTQESMDSLLIKYGMERHLGRNFWLKRFVFNQASPPVLIDTTFTSFSTDNLKNFYFDRGYFDAEVSATPELDSAKKKGKIIYEIEPGEKSVINSYSFNIKDSIIRKYYEDTWLGASSNIKVGNRYDMDNFKAERDKIVDYLKNRGYWRFNEDGRAIEFTADTTYSTKALDITLLIPAEGNDSALISGKFPRYRYGEIHIYPDSSGEPELEYTDTIYDGYHFHYRNFEENIYSPKYFADAIAFQEENLYSSNMEMQTRRNFSKREGITTTGFHPELNADRIIEGDGVIDMRLTFQRKKKYDFFYGAELSWSEFMNFGVSPNVSVMARNLFGGGENLDVSLKGTMGNVNKRFTDEPSFFNAFEIAAQSKLSFPYLLVPFRTDSIFGKEYYKQSDLRLGATYQRNIGLGRKTYSTGLDFNISFRDTHNHMLSFMNTEFVNNLQRDNYFNVFDGDNNIKNDFLNQYYFMYNPSAGINHFNGDLSDDEVIEMAINDDGFINTLDPRGLENLSLFENMNFRKQTITQNVLINSLIYQYTINQSEVNWIRNPWFFRGRVELSGNVLSLADKVFGFNTTQTASGKESAMILGVPFSQFFKIDVDLRRYFNLNSNSVLATRAYFGIVQPYGNTDFIPFVRSYTAGGSNDVRAWSAATLGPSDIPRYSGGEDVFAIDRMKLLFNVEYRFKINKIFNSALFVDAGNIWGTDKEDELTLFRFKDFYKQLGVGAGFGIRLDFTYFLIRGDFAYKIHDPSYPIGERWRFDKVQILKPHFTFGINYPF